MLGPGLPTATARLALPAPDTALAELPTARALSALALPTPPGPNNPASAPAEGPSATASSALPIPAWRGQCWQPRRRRRHCRTPPTPGRGNRRLILPWSWRRPRGRRRDYRMIPRGGGCDGSNATSTAAGNLDARKPRGGPCPMFIHLCPVLTHRFASYLNRWCGHCAAAIYVRTRGRPAQRTGHWRWRARTATSRAPARRADCTLRPAPGPYLTAPHPTAPTSHACRMSR